MKADDDDRRVFGFNGSNLPISADELDALVASQVVEAAHGKATGNFLKAGNAYNNAGLALTVNGNIEKGIRFFDQAISAYEFGHEARMSAIARINKGVAILSLDDEAADLGYIENALDELRRYGDAHDLSICLSVYGRRLFLSGHTGLAKSILTEAASVEREAGLEGNLADTLFKLAVLARYDGEESAITYLSECIDLASKVNDSRIWGLAMSYYGKVLIDQERYAEAIPVLRKILGLPDQGNFSFRNRHLLGIALFHTDNLAEALSHWTIALGGFQEAGEVLSVAQTLGQISTTYSVLLRNHRLLLTGASLLNADATQLYYIKLAKQAGMPLPGGSFSQMTSYSNPNQLFDTLMSSRDQNDRAFLIMTHVEEFDQAFYNIWFYYVSVFLKDGNDKAYQALISFILGVMKVQSTFLNTPADDQTSIRLEDTSREDVLKTARDLQKKGADLSSAGREDDSIAVMTQAMSAFKIADDMLGYGQCLLDIGICYINKKEYEKAATALLESMEVLKGISDIKFNIIAHNTFATLLLLQERADRALAVLEESSGLSRHTNDPAIRAAVELKKTRVFHTLKREKDVISAFDKAMSEIIRLAPEQIEGFVFDDLIEVYLFIGDYKTVHEKTSLDPFVNNRGLAIHMAMFLLAKAEDAEQYNRWAESESHMREALRLIGSEGYEAFRGKLHRKLAYVYLETARFEEAQKAIKESEIFIRKAGTPRDVAALLYMNGVIASKNNDVEGIVAVYEEWRLNEDLVVSRPGMLHLLELIVRTFVSTGRTDDAYPYAHLMLKQAEAIAKEGISKITQHDYFRACHALAELNKRTDFVIGDMSAVEVIQNGLEFAIKEQLLGEVPGLSLSLGMVLRAQGDLEGATGVELDGIKVSKEIGFYRARRFLSANAATGLFESGRFSEAEKCFNEAIQEGEKVGDKEFLGRVHGQMAVFCDTLGRRGEAKAHIDVALKNTRAAKDKDSQAFVLNHLSNWALHEGDMKTAEASCLEAINLGSGISKDVRSETYWNLSNLRMLEGKLDEAEDAIREAIGIGKTHSVEQAILLSQYATVCLTKGDHEKAVQIFNEALGKLSKDRHPKLKADIEGFLGFVHEALGNLQEAERLYRSSFEVRRNLDTALSTEQERLVFGGGGQNVGERLVALLLKKGDGKAAFEALETSKSRTFVQRLGFVAPPLPETIPLAMREMDRDLRKNIRDTENAMMSTQSPRQRESYRIRLGELMKDYGDVLANLEEIAPDHADMGRGKAVSFDEVREIIAS